jgi:hypothetical protein
MPDGDVELKWVDHSATWQSEVIGHAPLNSADGGEWSTARAEFLTSGHHVIQPVSDERHGVRYQAGRYYFPTFPFSHRVAVSDDLDDHGIVAHVHFPSLLTFPGQQVEFRTSVEIEHGHLETRFYLVPLRVGEYLSPR